ncbi:CU044_2847 family protein [Streptomyces odonnellii]|uniref:CU044_2847 family protein n=1 Tax=Streptomyces odonnellii TaxID=1417980 RepID=UPI00099BE823|nr:CU044_2847 family protein [Streptomyces odonnellii]
MTALMEFTTDSGATVLVEVARDAPGARPVGRGGNSLAQAGRTFDEALQGIRTAAESALAVFRGGSLRPDGVELEFGVKLVAEAGAVIAKTSAEGHMTVKLSWNPGAAGAAGAADATGATGADPGTAGVAGAAEPPPGTAGPRPDPAGRHPGTAGPRPGTAAR